MRKTTKIDYTKLLRFDTVSDRISDLDFRAGTVAARLGRRSAGRTWQHWTCRLRLLAAVGHVPSRPSSFALCSDATL